MLLICFGVVRGKKCKSNGQQKMSPVFQTQYGNTIWEEHLRNSGAKYGQNYGKKLMEVYWNFNTKMNKKGVEFK